MTQKEILLKKLERIERMEKLRSEGKSYGQIAKEFGVSQQRVYQLIGNTSDNYFTVMTKERCVYSGIRNYMNKQRLSVTALTRLIYGETHPNNYEKIRGVLLGSNCSKKTIDAILKVTGLTYEEAFGRSDIE